MRPTCKVCVYEAFYLNRKVRQAIARVDRYERKLIREISLKVAREMGKVQKATAREEQLELQRIIKKAWTEAHIENGIRNRKKIMEEKKAATKQREKEKLRLPEEVEKRRAAAKKRRQNETPEQRAKRLADMKEYRETHRDYYRQKSLEWSRNNPEKAVRAVLRRRAQKYNNGYEIYKTQDVIDIYGTNCHICGLEIDLENSRKIGSLGWKTSLQVDHVIPISKGGSDTLENVRPSHAICNMQKGVR